MGEPGVEPDSRLLAPSGLIRRARREADLSQRDLASLLGVSQSTVARWETGRSAPSWVRLAGIVALGGARVAITDDEGLTFLPMSENVIRDRAGRRFPAHVDPEPGDWYAPTDQPGWLMRQVRAQSRQDGVVAMEYATRWKGFLRRMHGKPEDHPTRVEVLTSLAEQDVEWNRVVPAPWGEGREAG